MDTALLVVVLIALLILLARRKSVSVIADTFRAKTRFVCPVNKLMGAAASSPLDKDEFRQFPLVKKDAITHNTAL